MAWGEGWIQTMTEFIIRRVLLMIPIMLFVGLICFVLIHSIPGSPAELMLGPEADAASIQALTEKMGYDKPLYIQLVKWLNMMIKGDFGNSIYSKKPVIVTNADKYEKNKESEDEDKQKGKENRGKKNTETRSDAEKK